MNLNYLKKTLFWGIICASSLSVNADVTELLDKAAANKKVARDASSTLRRFVVRQGWQLGWDNRKDRMIVIGLSEFDCKDPATTNNFMKVRDMHAKISALDAKAKIIEFINTQMSAEQKLSVPGTSAATLHGTKFDTLQSKMARYIEKIIELSAVTAGTQLSNSAPPTEQLEAIKAISLTAEGKLAKYCSRFIEAHKECLAIVAISQEGDNLTSEFTDTISTLSRQTLLGSVTLTQAESWSEDNSRYQIATLVTWSPKLERESRAVLAGKPLPVKISTQKGDIYDWLDKQDFAVMSGSRIYIDGKGQRWFIGIGVRETGATAATSTRARSFAQADAQKAVGFALFADTASQKVAATIAQSRQDIGGKEKTRVLEAFARNLSQKVNKQISGLTELEEKSLIHPISGKKILVSIYALNPVMAQSALELKNKQNSPSFTQNQPQESAQELQNVHAPQKSETQLIKPREITIDSVYKNLKKRGGGNAFGYNKTDGSFFVIMTKYKGNPENNTQQNSEIAKVLAEKELAGFLGKNLSAIEETSSYTDSNGKAEEFFRSATKVGIEQCLKGAQFLGLHNEGNTFFATYALSERATQMAQSFSSPQQSFANKTKLKQADGNTVIAVGIEIVSNGDIATAKRGALLAAQKEAISQVLGTMVSAMAQTQDMSKIRSKIFSHTAGFIDSYRVLDEGLNGNSYKMKIQATVSKDKLYSSYDSLLKTMGDPEFYIDTRNDRELNGRFTGFFEDLGFKVTNNKEQASYIIKFRAEYASRTHPLEGTKGTQLNLWVRLYDPGSKEVLMSIKNDPRKSAIFYGDQDRQKQLVVKKAFKQIKKPLHKKINSIISGMVQNGRSVTVKFDNYSDSYSEDMTKIQSMIENIAGVSSLKKSIHSINMECTFKLTYSGPIATIQEFLSASIKKEIPVYKQPVMKDSSTNKIIYSFE